MIQQVAFKNFRRFEDFPSMKLGNINIFVGRNNAGKSTVLKALQLMKGNLNTLSNFSSSKDIFASMRPMFVFDIDNMAELHIDNFERALYNKAKRKEITLSATIAECSFTIVLDGQSVEQNAYYVAVPYNFIELQNDNLHLTFNFQTRELSFIMKTKSLKENEVKLSLRKNERENFVARIKEVESQLVDIAPAFHRMNGENLSTVDMIELVSQRQKLEQSLKFFQKQLAILDAEISDMEKVAAGDVVVNIKSLPDFCDTVKVNAIAQIFRNLSDYAFMESKLDKRTLEYKEEAANQEKIKAVHDDMLAEGQKFLSALSDFEMEYIHAHSASPKVIYLKDDKNDALSRALSQFCKSRILPGSAEWTFVKKWMGEKFFAIGDDFRIDEIQSAGYTLRIMEDGEELNLADKGTGSIQLMTLLLSLAVIMHRVNNKEYFPTVLIEEPEQNIHPMLQSYLPDMFLEFWEKISVHNKSQLIIETHSEYLVRRTQIMAAEYVEKYGEDEMKEMIPFKVFYFPSEKGKHPYDMQYLPNGMFANKFDSGFFDEAGRMHMEILKKSKKR